MEYEEYERGFIGYGGRRKGQRGRPPVGDWRKHSWWADVSGAKASNWSRGVCWVWTRPCKGECPMITIRKRRVSVRRHLCQVILSEETIGVRALDPNTIMVADHDKCESVLCINPWHALAVSRSDFSRDVATAWQLEHPATQEARAKRQWEKYCAYIWHWHQTGVQGTHPIEDADLAYEFMQRYDKEFPGVRAEALAKSREMNRP